MTKKLQNKAAAKPSKGKKPEASGDIELPRILTPYERHKARLARGIKDVPMTDAAFAEITERMMRGEFPTDICDDPKLPSYGTLRKALRHNDDYLEEYEQAYAAMADMIIEEAKEFAREASLSGNIDDARRAEVYLKTIVNAVEKTAPRSHGALVKHAGADGGAITVSVVDYGRKAEE